MATLKIMTLAIRTIAKPIAASIKHQAQQHPTFRKLCVSLAQHTNSAEFRLRYHLLGQTNRHVLPLSEHAAIDAGANSIAEGFLFSVAAALILAEGWRTSRNQAKRRDTVDDRLDELAGKVEELTASLQSMNARYEQHSVEGRARNEELSKLISHFISAGLHSSMAEFADTPLKVPALSSQAVSTLDK